jgi:hypothetical protein
MRGHCGAAAIAMALMALTALGCRDGRGTRPIVDHAAALGRPGETPLELTGCVDYHLRNGYVLRLMPPAHRRPPDGAAVSSADPTGGHAAHLPAMEGVGPWGLSTSAGGPWVGTRAYRLRGVDEETLDPLIGRVVVVTGRLGGPDRVRAAGTDQMQAARGAIFRELQASAIEPTGGDCVAAARASREDERESPRH